MLEDSRTELGSLQGAQVLLIEDDATGRGATEALLQYHGAIVRSVDSAAAARELYTFLEGWRRLEQAQNLPRIPAIAVTAFARPEDRDQAIAAGFDHHLAKPLDGEKLVAVLSQLIG